MDKVRRLAHWARIACCRRRAFDPREEDSQLERCLGVRQLVFLGIGSTVGAGLYVIVGQVAKENAGPAVILSLTIAAIACLLSAICYAEFAVRLPRAGSAYVYSYVSVGELLAFVIGWNMVLENMIGVASVAKAWSQYLDSFTNDTIRHSLEEWAPLRIHGLDTHPDIIAFLLVIITSVVACSGARLTAATNTTFTCINVAVLAVVFAVGVFKIDGANWTRSFAPFGARGVLAGAGRCFYAMIGFDVIATSSEEAKDPGKTLPRAIFISLGTCFGLYFMTGSILTLLVPWYDLDDTAPLAKAFNVVGMSWAQYIVAIGAVSALGASLLGCSYSLSRVVYSMAKDKLLFEKFAHVWPVTGTPVLATLVFSGLGALLALLLPLNSLVEMMSIGTLLAYTLVSTSVLVLRYQTWSVGITAEDEALNGLAREDTGLLDPGKDAEGGGAQPKFQFVKKMWNSFQDACFGGFPLLPAPTEDTARKAGHMILVFTFFSGCLSATGIYLENNAWKTVLIIALFCIQSFASFALMRLPRNQTRLVFTCPFVPGLPLLSIFINTYIMLTLSRLTWLRFFVWQTLGFFIYFAYSARYSVEAMKYVDPTEGLPFAGEEIQGDNETTPEPLPQEPGKTEDSKTATTTK